MHIIEISPEQFIKLLDLRDQFRVTGVYDAQEACKTLGLNYPPPPYDIIHLRIVYPNEANETIKKAPDYRRARGEYSCNL